MDDVVEIVEFPETPVAALEHRGDPALIDQSVGRFIAWRKQMGLPPWTNATFNILYGDPAHTPPEAFRLDICVATTREIAANDVGIVGKIIAGGRCAVLRNVAGDDRLGPALDRLHRDWLPGSGEQLRDAPIFLQRFPEVMDDPPVLHVFVPLR